MQFANVFRPLSRSSSTVIVLLIISIITAAIINQVCKRYRIVVFSSLVNQLCDHRHDTTYYYNNNIVMNRRRDIAKNAVFDYCLAVLGMTTYHRDTDVLNS